MSGIIVFLQPRNCVPWRLDAALGGGDARAIYDGLRWSCGRSLAGFLTAVRPAGTSRVTTLPAPMIASSPDRDAGRMIAPPPIQTLRADGERAAKFQHLPALNRHRADDRR